MPFIDGHVSMMMMMMMIMMCHREWSISVGTPAGRQRDLFLFTSPPSFRQTPFYTFSFGARSAHTSNVSKIYIKKIKKKTTKEYAGWQNVQRINRKATGRLYIKKTNKELKRNKYEKDKEIKRRSHICSIIEVIVERRRFNVAKVIGTCNCLGFYGNGRFYGNSWLYSTNIYVFSGSVKYPCIYDEVKWQVRLSSWATIGTSWPIRGKNRTK